MSQVKKFPFHQTFCFVHYKFDLQLFKKRSRQDNNNKCMLLAYTKHSHPHINLYHEVIFLSWGGRILHKVESLTMILFLAPLDSFWPPASGRLTILLCSSRTETYNSNFGINYFLELP